MQTGQVEANLPQLNQNFQLPYIPDLIERKTTGPEKATLNEADLAFHQKEYERLLFALEEARDASALPETPTARPALSNLLVKLRLASVKV